MPRKSYRKRMLGGGADAAATGADAATGSTGADATAATDTGSAGAESGARKLDLDTSNPVNGTPVKGTESAQYGGSYQMIVPAAMVLANNYIGRGRSLRYRGKGAYRPKSSRFSRRRRATRRGYKK